ncbi:hypothetical protein AB0269_13610 [Microbacterium sp. NPDC077644]|uniref:hypothetical protein n=1 Tax=Microbacterium sp. NPDC077644 TaxID=3155055 RepID=UPI00344CA73F
MAVATPYIAFRYLVRDRDETESIAHELHDAVSLVTAWPVIEIEDAHVCRSAVHARVCDQIPPDEVDALEALRIVASSDHRDVMFAILAVIPP